MTTELPAGEVAQTSAGTQDAAATPQGGETLLGGDKPAAAATTTQEDASKPQTPAAGDKPAAETKPEGDTTKPAAETKPAEAAPEKYEFKAPEGTHLDPAVAEKFSAVAKELNLSQQAAQKVVDELAPALASAQREAFTKVVDGWVGEAKADKEFGGENFDANLAIAKEGLNFVGSPKLVQFLNQSGLGNHPEIIRAFYKVGQAISEDSHVSGTTRPAGGDKGGRTDTERYAAGLYGNGN